MRKQKLVPGSNLRRFDLLSEEIVFTILDFLEENTLDKKSFSLVCKSFYAIEARHREILETHSLRTFNKSFEQIPYVSNLDLSLCPRITDVSLGAISGSCKEKLRSINLSRSKFFSNAGLSNLVVHCANLVEIDLSNATELKDIAAAAIAQAKNLERLWLVRCKSITDIGLGCIAVGCRKLRLLSLKWCVGVGDLGVGLIAVKCRDIRSLDLSYLPITNKCLSQILELQHLEDLVLEGCFGLDDDGLSALKLGCKSLKVLDMSSCQNLSHLGLSSLTSAAKCLRQLNLSYGSQVDLALADSIKKLSMLQSIKLDGCQVTNSGLKAIGNWCISLGELSLSKCVGVTDEALSSIVTKHKELRNLDITCCRKGRDARFSRELDVTDNEIDDEGLRSISRCSKLSSLKLGICLNITDEGLNQIGICCSKLTAIDLYRSVGITDSSILAVARGCPGIEMISIAYCTFISDRSLIALSKCSKLKTLECRGCPLITSLGLAAIAVGCKQLAKLDIKKCLNIDDGGMIPLAHFSQNLKQINLSYTSVTDIGLLSLASISCLQYMSVLHQEGLTPSGLVAALLACGGLAKVKLHASFKSLLPHHLFEHLKSRGCTFQWRDKIFQAELDPKCWKLHLADTE